MGTRQAVTREYRAPHEDALPDEGAPLSPPAEIGAPDAGPPPAQQQPSEAGGSEYTRRLLAAKGRALADKQKKNSDRHNQ